VKPRPRHILAVIASLISIFGCAGNIPAPTIQRVHKIELPTIEVPSFRWDRSRVVNLDASNFPDSVSFFLPVGGDEKLDIENALLTDDVFGWADECDFSYKSYGIPQGANIVVVEDVSASMGDYIHFTDRLIWGYISTLNTVDAGEVALVRFGEEATRSIDWVLPDSFLNLSPDSIPYPDARGSDLFGALKKALDLAAERSQGECAIVLFSDGDLAEDIPYTLIERAKRYGVSINILMHGKNTKGALARLADETGGVYLAQPASGFSPLMVSAIVSQSFYIVYHPMHTAEDGALHRISLLFPKGRRFSDEFRAKGNIPDVQFAEEIPEKPISLPDDLLQTTIIPFDSAGNRELLPSGRDILDAYAAKVNSLPDSMKILVKIAGYACNLGATGVNIRLSKQRARVVQDYLRPLLGDNVSIETEWFGELYPLNENRNEAERRINRRVEITLDLE